MTGKTVPGDAYDAAVLGVNRPSASRVVLRGERVYLRRPVAADRDAFLAAVAASRELHHPWVYPPTTRQGFDLYLAHGDSAMVERFFVCRSDDDAVAGFVNLNNVLRGALQSASLGYAAFAPLHGQGLMSEGVQLVVATAFTKLQLHRVTAAIQPGNAPSLALIRRCGFRHEGFSPRYLKIGREWCDHERFALTVEEWRSGAGR